VIIFPNNFISAEPKPTHKAETLRERKSHEKRGRPREREREVKSDTGRDETRTGKGRRENAPLPSKETKTKQGSGEVKVQTFTTQSPIMMHRRCAGIRSGSVTKQNVAPTTYMEHCFLR